MLPACDLAKKSRASSGQGWELCLGVGFKSLAVGFIDWSYDLRRIS